MNKGYIVTTTIVALVAMFQSTNVFALDDEVFNGQLCNPSSGGGFIKDHWGIKNTSAANLEVFCPIDATFPGGSRDINLNVRLRGSTTNCELWSRSSYGSFRDLVTMTTTNVVADYQAAGTTAFNLGYGYTTFVACQLPPGTTLATYNIRYLN